MHDTRDERGSALVMALVVLAVIGVVVASALPFARTSIRSSNAVFSPNRTSLYAADGAVQNAIRWARDNPDLLQDLTGDCSIDGQLFTYTDADAGPVAVEICPQTDSFTYQGNFRAVLLTLSDRDGIALEHNGDVNVGGNVWSNADITLSNPTRMVVRNGRVWAWDDCVRPQNIEMDAGRTPVCEASGVFGGTKPPIALDPADASLGHTADWQPAAAPASLVPPAIPGCAAGTATLQPGVHRDAAALSALTNGGCANVVLAAGVHYLSFPAGNDTWSIADGVTVTGACNGTDQGVQVVFANASRIRLDGVLSLPCARRATVDGPLIAITSLQSAIGGGAPTVTALRPSTATQSGNSLYNAATLGNALPGPAVGYPADSTLAVATVSQNNRTAQLDLGSFVAASGPAIPAGAQVTSAVVTVRHSVTSNWQLQGSSTRLVWGSCTVPLTPATSNGALTTYTSANLATSLTGCSGFDPSQAPSVQWTWRTSTGSAATARVDGAELAVTWSTPGVAAQTGCPYRNPSCPVIFPSSNGKGRMVVEGVVYIPNGTIAGKFNNTGNFKVGAAYIGWSFDVDINPNLDGSPTIGNSVNQLTAGDLLFTARIAGTSWTRSRVAYPDGRDSPASIRTWVIDR